MAEDVNPNLAGPPNPDSNSNQPAPGVTPPLPTGPNWAATPPVAPPLSAVPAAPISPVASGLSGEVTVNNTAPSEPNDPYLSVSPISTPELVNQPEMAVPPAEAESEGSVSASTENDPAKVVATSHDGGSRRNILLILGALVLTVILLIVGSFIYGNLNQNSSSTASPSPTKAASTGATSPTTAATKTPTPVGSLPEDVPSYGSGTLTIVTKTKGEIWTDQKTTDSVDKVMGFYKKELVAKGWTVGTVTNEGAGKKLLAEKGNRQIVVLATPVEGQTTVGIVITNSTSLSDTGKPKPASSSATPTTSSSR